MVNMARPEAPFGLRVAAQARRDVAFIIRWSRRHFGGAAALRYEALIVQALRDIETNPRRPGSTSRPELLISNARTYHLSFSRDHVAGGRVQEPRHFVLYRYGDGVVEVGRILHDSRDLKRHVPDGYRLGAG